jgi:hypothetical protein
MENAFNTDDSQNASVIPDKIQRSMLDYHERHRHALIKLHHHGKTPVGEGWQKAPNTERPIWESWLSEGFNAGIHAGASALIIVDLDPAGENGDPNVWAHWEKWCKDHGLPLYLPHVVSPSGGWHLYFKIPNGARTSKPRERLAPGVDVLVGNKQSVAAGSYYDGSQGKVAGSYKFYGEPQPPYEAPAALLELCAPIERKSAEHRSRVSKKPLRDIKSMINFGFERGWFDEYNDWISLGQALKVDLLDDGLALWKTITAPGKYTCEEKWPTFADEDNRARFA